MCFVLSPLAASAALPSNGFKPRFTWSGLFWLALAIWVSGCSTPVAQTQTRHFKFYEDTFAYANQLVWQYNFGGANGRTTHHPTLPQPDYTHHCFVVARSARQFFENARFDPAAPLADDETYRRLIKKVVAVNPRHPLSFAQQIVIPGYSNLFTFSQAQESLLKRECGPAWQSYFQRGHWRMIFPLTRSHQDAMARQLSSRLQSGRVSVVHVVRFPQLSINHAMVLFDCKETADEIEFSAYDPNEPEHPVPVTFSRQEKRFRLPQNKYFSGGRIDVYEVYRGLTY